LSEIQTISVVIAAASVVAFVANSIITSRKTEKTQDLALKAQQQNLETRQAQLWTQVFNRYDEAFWRNYLLAMSKNYKSYEEWDKDRSDINLYSGRLAVAAYMMGLGTLVKRGFLSVEIVYDMIGSPVIMYWQKFSEYVKEYRVRARYPTYGEDLEYLYIELMRINPPNYSPKWYPEAERISQGGG
jgi:hypothetical protein